MEILVELVKVDCTDPITGFIYPRSVAVKAIEAIEERIVNNNGILGEEMPPPEEHCEYINPSKSSHVVKHMWIKGNTIMAKLDLAGKYRDMSVSGIIFQGFMRAFTSLASDKVTVDNMTIITIDLLYRER
jgi:hypothetical protein